MWRRGDYLISTDRSRLDLELVHRYLSDEAYWSPGVPREIVERSIEHSLSFGVFRGDEQVGFARVVTERHRRLEVGKWLLETVLGHPELRGLRRWMLAIKDAHGLYARFGFRPTAGDPRFTVIE